MEMLIAHVQQPPLDVCSVHPELQIPEPVAGVAMRLLAKSPDDRPASAQALIDEIEVAEADISGEMGATHVMSPYSLEEQPLEEPPPPPPPPRPAPRTSRTMAPQPSKASGAALRTMTPPPAPPPRQMTQARPAAPPPTPQVRVMPPPVVPVKKPSQAGIWAALGILVVALAGGAWYFTERKTGTEVQPPAPVPSPLPNPEPVKKTESANPPDDGSTKTGTENTDKGSQIDTGGEKTTPSFIPPKPPVEKRKLSPAPVTPAPRPVVDTKAVNAALKLGQFYFDRGMYEKAIAEFEHGIALDPSNPELRSSIARARKAKQAEDLLNQ
jgi:hypothetical protein